MRVRESDLVAVVFSHQESYEDANVLAEAPAGARAGSTEWVASREGALISLAWDWMCTQDNHVQILRAVAPRTNLCVIDTKGYDLPEQAAAGYLWNLIETISWQDHVLASLRK